jgi:iron complex transport system substrate-binding protein
MKVVSLLPSATEIVFALGLGDSLVGVTDECDFPPEAVTKPVVSRSALPQGRPLSAREIDRAVRGKLDTKEPLYVLDTDLLRREHPDVVLTQDLCRVCAVPSGQVQEALDKLGLPHAKVLSLDPNSLEEVIAQVDAVGTVLERADEAAKLTASLRGRVAKVKEVGARLPMLNVFCLEWSDPPFAAGHWVPEMVEAAAGVNLLSEKAGPSRVVTHREIRDANPEAIVFMPCGYYLEEAEEEAAAVFQHAELQETPAVRNGNVFAVDATSYFSRPGPRIVDGLEVLAWALHPDAFPEPPPGRISRVG